TVGGNGYMNRSSQGKTPPTLSFDDYLRETDAPISTGNLPDSSFARVTLLGEPVRPFRIPSLPLKSSRSPRNLRSPTGATALFSRFTRNLSLPSRNRVTDSTLACVSASPAAPQLTIARRCDCARAVLQSSA